MVNRLTGANTEDVIQKRLQDAITINESLNSRTLYFAQVINNIDPQNLNRIQCRIPIVDEDYYFNQSKDEGDKLLPWSIPFSNRFLEVPEVNTIVMVVVFDNKVPHFGRMFFDSFSEFSSSPFFDRLAPEEKSKANWDLVEDIFGIKINGKPKTQGEYNGKDNIIYPTGIRGKGKNRIVLDKDNIEIIQNKSESTESKIVLSQNIDVLSSDVITIKSKKGRKKDYHPIFDTPTFEMMSAQHALLKKIVTLLNGVPAISPGGPCMPGPQASSLISEMKSLSKAFSKYKKEGYSEKITIN